MYLFNIKIKFLILLQLFFFIVVIINSFVETQSLSTHTFPGTDNNIVFNGRVTEDRAFDWSVVSFKTKFTGTAISVTLNDTGNNYFDVFIDNQSFPTFNTNGKTNSTYSIASSLQDTTHSLQVIKRTEARVGTVKLLNVSVTGSQPSLSQPESPIKPNRKLEFIGDSITCGFGNLGTPPCSFSPATEDGYQTYDVMVSEKLSAEYQVVAWSGRGLVRNHGSPSPTSPDPMPAFYNRTLGNSTHPIWNFKTWIPSAVVINLGTNDFNTSPHPSQQVFESAYHSFLAQIRKDYEKQDMTFFLACGPMISTPCCKYIQNVVAQEHKNGNNKVFYVDLENILSSGDLGCTGHPNTKGHRKMASIMLSIISNVLDWS